ncbi:hypothetical protein M2302_006476 [Micromonospora sp. A200]|nr:hypothetical protein [Micromonospora sp. A200]
MTHTTYVEVIASDAGNQKVRLLPVGGLLG